MTRPTRIALALALVASAAAVDAQMKPEDNIRARQSIMRVVSLNFGPIAAMAQDKIPFNKEVFAANAARLEAVWAMNAPRFFVAGSDKAVSGSKIAGFTDAKPDVFAHSAEFKKAYDEAGKEIGKLAAAAKGGDEKAMKAAAGNVGEACKGCHDDFRVKQ
jgi:cytochrome c556